MATIKKPIIINLSITEICDSHCIMCNVWSAGKTDQFTPETIKSIFSQDFFSKVKHIGISGGEPTLNEALAEICIALLENVKSLKSLSITSHGYHTNKHEKILPIILDKCHEENVSFTLNLSVDGIGEMHTKVRRVKNAFEKVTATANLAKRLGIPVQLQCTITPVNVYGIVHVREFAIENNYDVIFRIASYIARLSNGDLTERIKLSDKQRSFVADFLEAPRTILATKSLGRRLFYSDLANRLRTDAPRLAPCSFQSDALLLSPDQSIYNCSRSEVKLEIEDRNHIAKSINSEKNRQILNNLILNTCKSCYHDQTGRWPLWKYLTVHDQYYFKFKSFEKIVKIPLIVKNGIFPVKKRKTSVKKLDNILIIGCYGGEHVGDAAVLGGVILRFKEKYGARNFTVLSIRPDRTRCWIQNISISGVSINVIGIKQKFNIENFDGLVLGGGPIMSIPILLSNHLAIIRRFKRLSKPFFIEGVGIGPLKDRITKLMAINILSSADSITVRTKKDYDIASKLGVNASKTSDPAFDYLLQLNIDGFKPHQALIQIMNTGKDIWVINLRPLWAKYANKQDILKNIEDNVINSVSSIIYRYRKNHRFIFMPMNSDQLGFSDLEIAYKLEDNLKRISEDIDFKIWECEPDINSCVFLLKKTKLSISMRFHGCIFSLSNNVPTVGIDYSTFEKGKVYYLFEDFNMGNNVINAKDIKTDILLEKINNILPS